MAGCPVSLRKHRLVELLGPAPRQEVPGLVSRVERLGRHRGAEGCLPPTAGVRGLVPEISGTLWPDRVGPRFSHHVSTSATDLYVVSL